MEQVTPDHQPLTLAFNGVDGVTRRVSQRWYRAYPWRQLSLTSKGLEPLRSDVRFERRDRTGEVFLLVCRCGVQFGLTQIEISLAAICANDRIGEIALAIISGQSTDVVGMHVGDIDFLNLLRRIA